MKEKTLQQGNLLFRIITRFSVFLLTFLLVLVIFYITGNFQDFLDSSLELILRSILVVSGILIFFSLSGVLDTIIQSIVEKNPIKILFLLFFLFAFVISAVLFAVVCSILFVSNGV